MKSISNIKIIAHRGLLDGPNKQKENTVSSILECLKLGLDVEIDVWLGKRFFLGHDGPKIPIDFRFLLQPNLWIHCKDLNSFSYLLNYKQIYKQINFFYHDKDNYTLTSKGIIWAKIGSKVNKKCVIVLEKKEDKIPECYGICTDWPLFYLKNV